MTSNPPSLLTFLQQCRELLLLQKCPHKQNPVLVIGNPSADLDSFASAVIYAYFHSLPPHSRPHIPILNVPFPSRDLRRQRPEFATAVAVRKEGYYAKGWEEHRKYLDEQEFNPDDDGGILSEVVTRHDLHESSSLLKHSHGSGTDAILVDWNSLAGDSSRSAFSSSNVSVFGCVDHHIDEHFVPKDTPQPQDSASYKPPRRIETVGSCTSLVIQHLQESSLLPSSPASRSAETRPCDEEAQTVQLALSAILIDTTNLTNKSKTTSVDVEAVELLSRTMGPEWDREKFHTEVKTAKTRGLELLTLEEVLGKDYKEWDISSSSQSSEGVCDGKSEKLGIASVVLPLKTLTSRSSPSEFLSTISSFAQSHSLTAVLVMTTSTSSEGQFQRELLLWTLTSSAAERLSSFVKSDDAKKELGLEEWNDVKGLESITDRTDEWRQVYWQREVSKSRKQVAPLLRKALGDESVGKE